jgi:outer membrane protein TolC
MRDIFEALGAEIKWNEETEQVTAIKGTNTIVLKIGSNTVLKNGVPTKVNVEPRIINERTMVPLRFVSEMLGANVTWDEKNSQVIIATSQQAADDTVSESSTDQKDTNESTAEADEVKEAGSLTYEAAVDMAKNSSYKVRTALADIERSKETLDKAADNVEYKPSSGGNLDATRAFTVYAQSLLGYQDAKKALELAEDSIAYAVKQAYNQVLQAQKALELAELTLQNAEWQKQLAQVRYENGVISEIDQVKANNDYNTAKVNRDAAVKALDDAYQKFNQLVGLPTDAKMTLTDIPQLNKLEDVNLDTKVAQVESMAPTIYKVDQAINLAQLQLDLYTFNNPSSLDTYKAKQIDVDKAQYTAADTKEQLGKSVRSMYYSIKQMEDQYDSLKEQLAKAEQTLKETQINYENGMAIDADLFAAKLAVEKIKQQMFDLSAQHNTMLAAFEKPWVAGGA